MFASTSPILDFSEDLLGYEQFARALATGISNRKNISEPYVIGIDASWGMGKTSAVNLIQKALEELSSESPTDTRRVHVVRFSPWLQSSIDVLALAYIGELTGALEQSFRHRLGADWEKQRKKLLKRFGRLLSAGASIPWAGSLFSEAGRALAEVAQESTEDLARDLRNRLSTIDAGQLVVIIDDLDRLHPDEMRSLLSLVMTFGNLPRVTHVLLYDRAIVDGAMRHSLGHGRDGGPTYLEKIIQLPAALPAADPVRLRDFFFFRLRACVDAITPHEEALLRELWRMSLQRVLNSPRDITRLANSIAATWPAISDHADLYDFIGIEALRILRPRVWATLCTHRRVLVGEWDPTLSSDTDVPSAKDIANGEGPAVEELVAWLFPLTNKKRPEKRGQRSISSPASVDVYFRFQPGGVVARSRTEALLRLTNWRDLADALRAVSDRRELRSIIYDLAEVLHIGPLSPEDGFFAFIDCADAFITGAFRTPPALHDIEMFRDIDELLWNTFARIPVHRRADVFRMAADQSRSVAMIAVVWQRLCLHGGFLQYTTTRPDALLPEDDVIGLGTVVAARLRREARDGALSRTPMLGWILSIWNDTGSIEEAQKATAQLLEDDWGLLNIVDGVMGHAVSSSDGAYRTIRGRTPIAGHDLESIRLAAIKALTANTVPFEIAKIGRELLEAFVNSDEWEKERLSKD